MGTSTINSNLYDLWNFHLVVIGFSLSIFTLLYSFILNKRYELKTIAEQIKSGDKSPLIFQKEKFAIKYIMRLKIFNKNCIYIFITSTILFCCSWIALRFVDDSQLLMKEIFVIIIEAFTILLCFYLASQFVKIYQHYNSETKI